MLRAGYGLMWEEWRRTRTVFGWTLGLIVGSGLLLYLRARTGGGMSYTNFSRAFLLGYVAYLPLSQSSKNDIQAGIPTRRYILPVGTFPLVFWPLLYRLATVALASVLAGLLSRGLFGSSDSILTPLCLLTAVTALIHMLAWSARLVGKVVTALGFFVLFFLSVEVLNSYYDPIPLHDRIPLLPLPWRELILPGIAVPIALLLTTLALKILRRGGWGYAWKAKGADARDAAAVLPTRMIDRGPFPSTGYAQMWFEWRSVGARMTVIICWLSCPMIVLYAFPENRYMLSSLVTGCVLSSVVAVAVGMWAFAKNSANARRGPALFTHTRPLSDARLMRGKLESAGMTVLFSLSAAALVSAAAWVAFDRLGLDLGRPQPPIFPRTWALLPLALILGWLAYCRGAFILIVAVIVWLVSGAAKENAPETYAYLWDTTTGMPPILEVVLALCSLVLGAAFALAFLRRTLSWRMALVLTAVWAAGTAVVSTALLPNLHEEFSAGRVGASAAWAFGAMAALLALSPIATVSLSVRRLRHR